MLKEQCLDAAAQPAQTPPCLKEGHKELRAFPSLRAVPEVPSRPARPPSLPATAVWVLGARSCGCSRRGEEMECAGLAWGNVDGEGR